jgi:phosphoenolpyruvate carboxykinase (ATP)
MNLPVTRALVQAAVSGVLDNGDFLAHPAFHCMVPTRCPGVDDRVLDPRQSWMDRLAYERSANELARRFEKNFRRVQCGCTLVH